MGFGEIRWLQGRVPGDVVETFPKVGGVLVWVGDDPDTAGLVEGANVGEERVKITDYRIRELGDVSFFFL